MDPNNVPSNLLNFRILGATVKIIRYNSSQRSALCLKATQDFFSTLLTIVTLLSQNYYTLGKTRKEYQYLICSLTHLFSDKSGAVTVALGRWILGMGILATKYVGWTWILQEKHLLLTIFLPDDATLTKKDVHDCMPLF